MRTVQAVAFSAVGGAGEQHAIINAKVGDAISVTLSTVIGYVPLIVAASAAGVGDLKSMGVPELSASEVRDAITKPPLLPNGLESAAQPVPVPSRPTLALGRGTQGHAVKWSSLPISLCATLPSHAATLCHSVQRQVEASLLSKLTCKGKKCLCAPCFCRS